MELIDISNIKTYVLWECGFKNVLYISKKLNSLKMLNRSLNSNYKIFGIVDTAIGEKMFEILNNKKKYVLCKAFISAEEFFKYEDDAKITVIE